MDLLGGRNDRFWIERAKNASEDVEKLNKIRMRIQSRMDVNCRRHKTLRNEREERKKFWN